jgi:hypothetical protein
MRLCYELTIANIEIYEVTEETCKKKHKSRQINK